MPSINKVILVGNCGQNAEIRYTADGQPVTKISLATSFRRKDKSSGEYSDETQWHRITFYDRLAQVAGEYIKKGSPIYIEGRIKYGKFIDKAGTEKISVDIIASDLQLLGGRVGGSIPATYDGAGECYAAPAPKATSDSPTGRDDMEQDSN